MQLKGNAEYSVLDRPVWPTVPREKNICKSIASIFKNLTNRDSLDAEGLQPAARYNLSNRERQFFLFIYQKQVSRSKLQPSDMTQTISHSFPILGSVQSASEHRNGSKIRTTYFCLSRPCKVRVIFCQENFRGEADYMHFVSSVVYHFPKNSGNSGWNVNGIRLPGWLEWKVIKLVNPLFKEGSIK